MEKQDGISNKDSRLYITAHLFSSELGAVIYSFFCFLIFFIKEDSHIIQITLFIILSIIFIFIKLFGVCFYYTKFYTVLSDFFIKKLLDILKKNQRKSRLIFLFVISLPYSIVILNNLFSSNYARWYYFFESILFMYFMSAFIPYKILFYYWDVLEYKNKNNANVCQCIKFIIKKMLLFILISIFIFVSFLLLSEKYKYC